MIDLRFQVDAAEPMAGAVSPTLALKLAIRDSGGEQPIQNILLQCQIRIEAVARRHSDSEQARLFDLFGEPRDWGRTLTTMLWTHASMVVPPFAGSVRVDLPVACTYDFNIGATKYFDALEDGEAPLCLLFSGTVFYKGEDGALQMAPIPWDSEAQYRLPVEVWRRMMREHYPNSAWLCLRKDVFDRLREHKSRCGLPTWEQAVESLLETVSQPSFTTEAQGHGEQRSEAE